MNVSPEQLGFRLLSKLVGARILASTLLLAVCLLLARPTCANPTPNANNQSTSTPAAKFCPELHIPNGVITYTRPEPPSPPSPSPWPERHADNNSSSSKKKKNKKTTAHT
eukprot:scpid96497/ scgid30486/ 